MCPPLQIQLSYVLTIFFGALYHEGGPPLEVADLLTHSMPHLLLEGGMAQRGARAIMADQK